MTTVLTESAAATQQLGRRLGELLGPGDLILLHGDLGAGKTTFTQGLAEGLQVLGRVTSPTFIVARVHDSAVGGPDLIHVDAYRIEDDLDLETLDLDSSLDSSVTVVEWGAGKAEILSPDRLEITLAPAAEATSDAPEDLSWETAADEARQVRFTPVGQRWAQRLSQWDPTAKGEVL